MQNQTPNTADILTRLADGSLSTTELNAIRDTQEYQDRIKNLQRYELLPMFFKFQGQPFSLDDYPQYREMYSSNYVNDTIFLTGRQTGKCQTINDLQQIVDEYGRIIPFDKLVPGLRILSLNSSFKCVVNKITDKFKSGVKPLYKIKTRLGSELSISLEHRLKTLHEFTALKDMIVGTRIAHLRRGGQFGARMVPRARIALTAYMIGDGCCRRSYGFTSETPEVLDEFKSYIPADQLRVRLASKSLTTYALYVLKKHPMYEWFKEDNLDGKYSYEKTLPSWVYELSKEDTALFISRLWATDGSIKLHRGFPAITYCTTSLQLARQVRDILHKFGIVTCIRHKQTKCNGKRCRDAHELRVEGQESQKLFLSHFNVPGKGIPNVVFKESNNNRQTIPIEIHATLKELFKDSTYNRTGKSLRDAKLRVKPKYPLSYSKLDEYIKYAEECNLQHKEEYKFLCNIRDGDVVWDEIESIEYAGEHEAWDITVEDTECFIVDGLVSHNSINLSRSEIMDCLQIPNFQIVYLAPLKPQAMRYSSLYLSEAINTCPYARLFQDVENADGDCGPLMKNLSHRSFINGSGIQLTYAKSSSDRARGIFADRIDFDEVQDQLIDNLPIVTQSLTQSNWQLRKFTGTAKTVDNTIEALWQMSDQKEWVVKCSGCNYYNIPNLEGKVFEMIQAVGPCCIKCGKLLNMRTGSFVAKYPKRSSSFTGYHIPQIVVPSITENPVKWSTLVNKVINSPMPIIMQEILGISCNVGARIITQEDIDKCSCLPTINELQKNINKYVFTVGGVDWGIAEVSSFTVHTIIGITGDGKIDVLWAKRFMGFDPDTVLQEIAKAHTIYKCDIICCDFGMGFDKNVMLERRFGLNVIQIEYSAQKQLLNFRPILGYNRWMVDKVSALDALFWTIKYQGIRFPPKREFEVYTKDLLSPYESITELSGIQHRKYLRNPNLPDDFCHSLCYATLGIMRLSGHATLDVIPDDKMNERTIASGDLVRDNIDPATIMQALNG